MIYRDIFFTPEYQELFRETAFGGEPCHFNASGIDYRFYKRPIRGTEWFDIVSPYGYTGPVAVDVVYRAVDFLIEFSKYCLNNRIIAEFARLHPFCEPDLLGDCTVFDRHYEHDIFYIDLTQTEDQIWKGFDKGCKSAIKKAEQRLHVYNEAQVTTEFIRLYQATMARRGASMGYLFDRQFFHNFNSLMLFHNQHFNVWLDDEIIAAGLFLRYGDYCHYFLSGSTGDHEGATNLMLWSAIKWAKSQGCKIFNLGGGLKEGDSLESFKRSFTKSSKPFYTYRHIVNQPIYKQLCKEKGIDPNSPGFFPAYRR